MKDIYGNQIIGRYGLNNQFVGKIVSLDEWDSKHIAKIYIQELMPSIDYGKKVITETMYNSNLRNNQYSNKIINITIDNGIDCKQIAINNELVKPIVGNDVIVLFIDNDIKKAVFYNMSYTYNDSVIIKGDKNVSDMEE